MAIGPAANLAKAGVTTVNDLALRWRGHAEILRRYGDHRGARLLESLAQQLEEAIREQDAVMLTLSQAAEESGYSKRRLRELITEGKLTNHGAKGRPRIRRGDLPMRPGRTRPPTGDPAVRYDPREDARALVSRMGRR